MEIPNDDKNKHKIKKKLWVFEVVALIFTRVEKFVSINEPDQEGAIKNDKHCYLEIVNIVIVVSDHPNFNQVGHSTGSKDKEVP